MYISELTLENFRGFKNKTSICFNEGTNVIIGHNNAGKTSIIKALELLFDNTKNRHLTINDFNKNIGIDELKEKSPKIRIQVKLSESENEEEYSDDLVTVSTWLTELKSPYEALMTYEFFLPQKEEDHYIEILKEIESDDKEDYWYAIETNFLRKYIHKIYVGNLEQKNVVDPESINKFDFQFLTAIRDVEKNLFSGRSSLLKEIIDFFMDYEIKTSEMEENEKEEKIKEKKKDFSKDAGLLIKSLKARMELGKEEMLKYAKSTGASFDNLKPDFEGRIVETELYSALKLIVEDKTGIKLPVTQNGLGYNNLIYISLLLAKMQKNASGDYLGSNAKTFSILAIEEPEAHLHPNMQYKFLNFLKENQKEKVNQIFVTSHSPNITAAVDLDDIIILYKHNNEVHISYPGKVFDPDSDDDMISKNYVQRFLDVTKADMFFAKSLILVEGISEQLLVPEFAKILDKDLTDSHVSVINIGGRYFEHFLKLFNTSKSEYAIKKKVACITDLDPQKKKNEHNHRWKKCWPFDLDCDSGYEYKYCSNPVVEDYSGRTDDDLIRSYSQEEKTGCTFEYDLILVNPDNKEIITNSVKNDDELRQMLDSFKNGTNIEDMLNLINNKKFKDSISHSIKNCSFTDNERCKHVIAARYLNSVKKGAVAQELAYLISKKRENIAKDEDFDFNIPQYISEAIEWIY